MEEGQSKDDSPIVLTIESGTEYFAFCHTTIHLYDAMFHTAPSSALRSSRHFLSKLNTASFSGLLIHFLDSGASSQSKIALSLNDMGVLLSMASSINGILLSDDEEELLLLAEQTFSGITEDWVNRYRTLTDNFIGGIRNKYKTVPKMLAWMDKLFENE